MPERMGQPAIITGQPPDIRCLAIGRQRRAHLTEITLDLPDACNSRARATPDAAGNIAASLFRAAA